MDKEAAFREAINENPADLSLRLIYADWLMEQGDPRGELLALWYQGGEMISKRDAKRDAKETREARRRFTYLRGIVSLIPEVERESMEATFRQMVARSIDFGTPPDWCQDVERLARQLQAICHPLAERVLHLATIGIAQISGLAPAAIRHSSHCRRAVEWNPGGKRFVVTHGHGNASSEPGGYPDPLEAAVAGLVSVETPPVKLYFAAQVRLDGSHVAWPSPWEHLRGVGDR